MLTRCFGALAVLALSGCGTTALWRAGVVREEDDDVILPLPRTPADDPGSLPLDPTRYPVFLKQDFGACEETESERRYVCGSTTVVRKAFLFSSAETWLEPLAGAPLTDELERDYEVVGWVTTEEFPRDERASELRSEEVFEVFGIGDDPWDLFDVRLDAAFGLDAIQQLRAAAAGLGGDAVIDVFGTGEAEHHMFQGTAVSFSTQSVHSPIYSNVRLLEWRLRDVRLHGTVVRYVD